MKNFFSILFFLFVSPVLLAQNQPKLIVGIVVDQMRYDYIARYYNDFEKGGFRRLTDQGFLFKNGHYDHVPTQTGPGHSSVYTGTTPSRHGIIGNDWYSRSVGGYINCVEDTMQHIVGGLSDWGVSPVNVQTTTITDELRLFYNFQSKVVSISIKDRGAVIPGGHNPTGAYWYDSMSGKIVTSTYYRSELPKWVQDYNNRNRPRELMSEGWSLLRNEETYNESISDENDFEQEMRKGLGISFPYNFRKYKKDPSLIKYTPFSNTLIKEVAIEALKAEQLGADHIPDFLALSFSATDAVGHRYGPRSMEIQDTYLRLDLEIQDLLHTLDDAIGENNYIVFLTADHGATDVPFYLIKNKMPAGYHNNSFIKSRLNEKLEAKYGNGKWVSAVINEQVYLNHDLIKKQNVILSEIKNETINVLLKEEYIFEAFTSNLVSKRIFTDPMLIRIQNGFNTKRSGDIIYVLSPSNLNGSYGRKGTSHLSGYTYDTHVPILFFGKGIKKGSSVRPVEITDIAPSLSMLLNISLPSGATGQPLTELFE